MSYSNGPGRYMLHALGYDTGVSLHAANLVWVIQSPLLHS